MIHFISGVSLQINFYMTRAKNAVVTFDAIVKIHKYNGLHEGHHFILMAMEVHNTLGRDMDHFIRECVHLLHDRRLKGHFSLSFFKFSSNMLVLFSNII